MLIDSISVLFDSTLSDPPLSVTLPKKELCKLSNPNLMLVKLVLCV